MIASWLAWLSSDKCACCVRMCIRMCTQEAPYLLEPLLESFTQEEVCVRLAFLTAATQLFFKRPPEFQALLGQLLVAGLADTNQDVHDRALLYYRYGLYTHAHTHTTHASQPAIRRSHSRPSCRIDTPMCACACVCVCVCACVCAHPTQAVTYQHRRSSSHDVCLPMCLCACVCTHVHTGCCVPTSPRQSASSTLPLWL